MTVASETTARSMRDWPIVFPPPYEGSRIPKRVPTILDVPPELVDSDDILRVNFGPNHPSTHGVLRLILDLDGEQVVGLNAVIGYLHTGFEKTMEQKTWWKCVTYPERIDYVGYQNAELVFVLAVEQLLSLEVPEKATWMRMLLCELNRIHSHLVFLGTSALELGAISMFWYCFRERETILDLYEMVTGARMHTRYFQVGGLAEDILREPAHLEVAGVHARARDHLVQVEDRLALAEAVPEHRDRTQLERRRAEEDEVRMNAVQLAEQHAHPRRLLGDLEREQLLDCEHEDELRVLVADVVDALRIRDALPPRLLLHRLLEAGVQVADDCVQADDLLAVEVEDQAEHAVRRRMVRPEVDPQDVVAVDQLGRNVEDRRHPLRDARALVRRREDDRPVAHAARGCLGCDRHSASEKRTGSPPIG